MFLCVCDYHTNRVLVLWGTRSLAHETTGTEGGEDTDPGFISESLEANHNSHSAEPMEQVEVGLQRTDRETGRYMARQVECQVLLVTEEKCLFLHLRPTGNLLKSRQER